MLPVLADDRIVVAVVLGQRQHRMFSVRRRPPIPLVRRPARGPARVRARGAGATAAHPHRMGGAAAAGPGAGADRRERAEAVRSALERDDFSLNRHPALASCLSMIFSENRCTLFGIML